MRRIFIGLVVILLGAGGLGFALRGQIALALYDRGIARAMTQDALAELPDALSIGLCGSGSPLPDPERAGPCVVIVAGTKMYLVDIGEGGSRNIGRMGLPGGRIEALFLTHFHSDHIDSLGPLMLQRWVGGNNTQPLPIYGPEGVEDVVKGFNQAYSLDRGYRVAHHGPDIVHPTGFGGEAHTFALTPEAPTLVLEQDGLSVHSFAVEHNPIEPAVGYIFEYKGRKIVVSGDTRKTKSVVAAAKGADLLAHEALSPELVKHLEKGAKATGRDGLAHIMNDILNYHTSPEEAAEQARDAGVGYLLLYHIVPALPISALEGPFLGRSREIYSGPIRVGHDGDFIILPVNSKNVLLTHRL